MCKYLGGVLFVLPFLNCDHFAAHLLMFCGPLVAHLPQIVQHYPYLTEKSFDPQAR